MRWQTVKVGARFVANRVSLVAKQDGYGAAASVAVRTVATELRKLPRLIRLLVSSRSVNAAKHPTEYSAAIVESLRPLPVEVKSYCIDPSKFESHIHSFGYPRAYAAGALHEGGFRENKLLEYFLTLEILEIQPHQVIIDVASEYSIFPTLVHQVYGATVFRQDQIYPQGIHRDRIGGSATAMPVSDEFADALVLHNSFEHFEGSADSDFIAESWRVLRPGGTAVIVPLFVSDEYCIISDPLTDRRGIVWDAGARVTELPGWHNRFGRFYSASALDRRVLAPAMRLGYELQILHFVNVKDVHPLAGMHFSLVLRKPHHPRVTSAGSPSVG